MNQFLKKVYYQFYVWGCRYNFANSPHLSAMYMLSLLLTIDVLSVIMLVKILSGDDKLAFLTSIPMLLSLLVTVTAIIYFSYTRNKKYLVIFNKYNSSTSVLKRRIKVTAITFVVFSIVTIYLVAFILSLYNRGIVRSNL